MRVILLMACLLAQDPGSDLEKEKQEFEKRVKVETEKMGGVDFHRVKVDDGLVYRDFGGAPKIDIVEENGGRSVRVTQDGKTVLQFHVPDLGTPLKMPPVIVGDAQGVKVDSKVTNGQCTVTIDGKTVYNGPGSKVSSKASMESSSKDGKSTTRRFAEVYVDDKLVYRAGEALPDPNPKNKDQYKN